MTSWMRGLRVVVVAACAAVLTAGFAGPASAAGCPPSDHSGAASRFVSLINAERAAHGLGTVSTHGQIGSVAQSHAQTMAAAGTIFHNAAFMGMIDSLGATMLAENVGVGCSVDSIHAAFMNSPTHKDNILTGALTHVGLGTASDGSGRLYVVEAFAAFPVAPAAAPVAPKPAPAEPAPAQPAPAPDPVPTKARAPEPPAQVPAEAPQPVPAVAEAAAPPVTVGPATPPESATQPMRTGATLEAEPKTMPVSSTGRLPVQTGAVTVAFVAAGMAYLFMRRPALEPAWEAAAMALRAQPWPAWDAVRS